MALGCAAALSACGGGGGAATPPSTPNVATTPAPAVPTHQTAVLIKAYGDSTIEGMTSIDGTYQHTPYNAPADLQTMLQDRFGKSITISNMGIGGTTAQELLNGTDGSNLTWSQKMSASKAQIVLIEYGINDMLIPGTTVDAFTSTLQQIVSIAQAAGKTVILETPNPINTAHNAGLWSFANVIKTVAAQYHVTCIDEFTYLIGQSGWAALLSDGIHPTISTYQLKANYEFRYVEPIVAAMLGTWPSGPKEV